MSDKSSQDDGEKPSDLYHRVEATGNYLVDLFHLVGLFVIGAVIVWAAGAEFAKMIAEGGANIKEVLLLFIYLEFGAMVGIYFKTKRLSVRFLLYIAITALTRVLAIDVKTMSDIHMVTISRPRLAVADVCAYTQRHGR